MKIVRTFVNVAMFPQCYNKMIIKTWKKPHIYIWCLSHGVLLGTDISPLKTTRIPKDYAEP
jgi:uncharacterized membrane protein